MTAIRVRPAARAVALGAAAIAAAAACAATPGVAVARDYHPAIPVLATSPWPEHRHDAHNTGRSTIRARYDGSLPWRFHTGRGIFASPIIGGDGTVYIGSADTYYYAINRDGTLRWKFKTGNIIDAAGVIGRYDRKLRTAPITIGSGDEVLYHLRSDERRLSQRARTIWRFRPTRPPAPGQLVRWWEGNVAIGPDGDIYTGNTGGTMYHLTQQGKVVWTHDTGNSVWTTPAFGAGGRTFWGSVDLYAYGLNRDGSQAWKTLTIGYVTSSPALGSDGTVYIGSFDGKLYALDPANGVPRWTFATGDHMYPSPALAQDAAGRTTAIYTASADGSIYAIDTRGRQIWRYDTGEAIRSSPVVGPSADGRHDIVYVGSSNGRLYAIDANTGHRRWSFDTTPRDPQLRDRNDLNGSPALGERGVVIGGEHGDVWQIPYDYCLHRTDRRCSSNPGQELGNELNRVLPVDSGGNTSLRVTRAVAPATQIVTRLVVRRSGQTLDAQILPAPSSDALVKATPPFAFSTQLSGDGHYLFITPTGFLRPGTAYAVRVAGTYTAKGVKVGGITVGGTDAGPFGDTIRFRTATSRGPLPLAAGRTRVTAFELRRLAIPLPPLLPSVNQIGFDSYDLVAGTIARSEPDAHGAGSVLLWVLGAKRGAGGRRVVDPASDFAFPLAGRYQHDFLLLESQNLNLRFSFGDVPLRRFDIRGQIGADLAFRPGASLSAEVTCAAVPNYGPYLFAAGICNKSGTLAASGTFLTNAYDRSGPANRRPPGVSAGTVTLTRPTATADGLATATVRLARGAAYRARDHLVSLLLTDADSGTPVAVDYRKASTRTRDRHGNATGVRVVLPAGTAVPARVKAWILADVFPLGTRIVR